MSIASISAAELGSLFLFSGLDGTALASLAQEIAPETVDYKKGDTVYSPHDYKEKLGFVLRGVCRVCLCRSSTADLSLNTLHPGDCFGILALFCEGEYPTNVLADGDVRILFFTKQDIFFLIEHIPTVALNLLRFLAGRVDFLNKKLRTLTAKDAEAKLAAWILLHTADDTTAPIDFHATRTAQALGCGRASLYRALEALVNEGAILYSERKIEIVNKFILERIST